MNNSINKHIPEPKTIILAGLAIRIICAFIIADYKILPEMAVLDALQFHESAVNFSVGQNYFMDTIEQGQIFVIILGILYKFISPDFQLFAGGILSSIVWAISAMVLYKILILTKTNNLLISIALIIYSTLPFGIVYTVLTLREVYQLLLINLILYYVILIFKQSKIEHVIKLLVVFFCLFFFHRALIFFILFVIFILLLNHSTHRLFKYYQIYKFILLSVFILAAYIYIPYYTEFYNYIIDLVQDFKSDHPQRARALYKDQLIITYERSYFLFSVIHSFIQFEFEPYPWRETVSIDYILIAQNSVKLFVYYVIIKKLILSFKTKNLNYFILLSMFIFLELLWSAGTVNWGTAVRHQVPGYGMLIFLTFVNVRKIK